MPHRITLVKIKTASFFVREMTAKWMPTTYLLTKAFPRFFFFFNLVTKSDLQQHWPKIGVKILISLL